jgi:hypothetical protein
LRAGPGLSRDPFAPIHIHKPQLSDYPKLSWVGLHSSLFALDGGYTLETFDWICALSRRAVLEPHSLHIRPL